MCDIDQALALQVLCQSFSARFGMFNGDVLALERGGICSHSFVSIRVTPANLLMAPVSYS